MGIALRRAWSLLWIPALVLGILLWLPAATHLYAVLALAGVLGWLQLRRLARDERARRQAETALAISERRLRLITESMQEILWLRVGDGIQYVNSACERVTGLPPQEMMEGGLQAWLPSIHPEDRERMRLALDQATTRHEPLDEEFRLVRVDGQERWLHARTVHVEAGPDGLHEAVGVAADITARRQAEETLRATVARYRLLFEAVHVGITITDPAGNLLYANPSFAELIGASSVKDLLTHARRHGGLTALLADPRQFADLAGTLQADERGRAAAVLDLRRLDGRASKLHVSCGLSVNPETGRTEIFAIHDDVTERLRAEAELRSSEERYRHLVEFLPDGVLVHDGRRVVFGNPASARLFGAAAAADLDATILEDLVPPESLAYFSLSVAAEGEHRVPGPDEIWLRRLDGTLFPAAVTSLPLDDITGPTILTVIKDLTSIRRFGEEIALQQEILGALVETMPLGIVAKDLAQDLRYVVWNRYMEQELGLAKDEVLGRRDSELFDPPVALLMRRHDQLAAESGETQDLGEISLDLGERRLDLHVVKVPVRDADGRVARVFSLVENVTRQKQLQSSLQQARKMEAVGRLAGAVAHDFNNMLQVVQGYAEALDQIPALGGRPPEAALILTAVGRARELVQRLLTYSRYEALRPQMMDLDRAVDQLAALGRGLLPPSIRLTVRQAADLPPIYADPQQIEQALLNLVINARDALPGEGRIEIETSLCELGREFCSTRPWARPGRYVQVTVRDDGCGIPPDARDHIYEPFYTTKGFGRGTGLGLATTYSICKQHQGYIDFESELDVGTSFHVFLPVLADEAAAVAEPAAAAELLTGRGELVLLVEDDDMVRSLTRQVLERAHYQVLEARDGEDAMEVFMANAAEIQLLVLDVVMPRMDGRALYDNISELRPGVPVLFCSSYSAGLLESEYMLQVGGSLLAKPYRAADLLERVRALLDRAEERR